MNNPNQEASNFLDQAFLLWKLDEVDEENQVEYRQPTTKQQVDEGQELINKARACNPDDKEVIDRMNEYQAVLDNAKEKHFGGNKLFLYGVIIAVLLWGGFYLYTGFGDVGKNYTVEQASQILNGEKNSANQQLTYLNNLPDETENKASRIKDAEERIEKLSEYNADDYKTYLNRRAFWRGIKSIFYGIFYLILLGLYYWSAIMPQYMINKRKRELELMSKGTTWIKRILFGIIGIFISMPMVEYYDKWSDGSVTYSDDNLSMGMLQLAIKYGIPVLIIVIVAYIIIAILPILIIINVLRNKYPNLVKEVYAKVTKKS